MKTITIFIVLLGAANGTKMTPLITIHCNPNPPPLLSQELYLGMMSFCKHSFRTCIILHLAVFLACWSYHWDNLQGLLQPVSVANIQNKTCSHKEGNVCISKYTLTAIALIYCWIHYKMNAHITLPASSVYFINIWYGSDLDTCVWTANHITLIWASFRCDSKLSIQYIRYLLIWYFSLIHIKS